MYLQVCFHLLCEAFMLVRCEELEDQWQVVVVHVLDQEDQLARLVTVAVSFHDQVPSIDLDTIASRDLRFGEAGFFFLLALLVVKSGDFLHLL